MLWLTENDLKNFFAHIIREVAKELNIKDGEWRYNSELLEHINSESPMISKKLEEFFAAYKQWHELHVKVCLDKIEGHHTVGDDMKLNTHILSRDDARRELLKALSE